jgi:hypothetical protein
LSLLWDFVFFGVKKLYNMKREGRKDRKFSPLLLPGTGSSVKTMEVRPDSEREAPPASLVN